MNKYFLTLIGLCLLSMTAQAQLKVGKNPKNINPNAIFEMESDTSGILLPRVALFSTLAFNPLKAHVAGMKVYNTATAGIAPNNVTPGVYYNDGTKWVRLDQQPSYLNGISQAGDSILLGGNLVRPTTITQTATKDSMTFATDSNKLKITGLVSANASYDSALVIDPNTGQLKIRQQNGLYMRRIKMANANNQTILDPNTPGANVPIFATYEDSTFRVLEVTVETRTPGVSFKVNASSNTASGYLNYGWRALGYAIPTGPSGPQGAPSVTAAENGLTFNAAQEVELGGSLIQPTTINTYDTAALNITGLQNANNANDSFLVIDYAGSGPLKRASVPMYNLRFRKVKLLNNLSTQAINDAQTPAGNIPIIVTYEDSTGKMTPVQILRRTPGVSFQVSIGNAANLAGGFLNYAFPPATIIDPTGPVGPKGIDNPIVATNGIELTGVNYALDGNLIKPTSIQASFNNNFAIQGLQSGNPTDDVLAQNDTTGVFEKRSFERKVTCKRVKLGVGSTFTILDANAPTLSEPLIATYETPSGTSLMVNVLERNPGVSFTINSSYTMAGGYLNYCLLVPTNTAIVAGPQGSPGSVTNTLTSSGNSLNWAVNGTSTSLTPALGTIESNKYLAFDTSGTLIASPYKISGSINYTGANTLFIPNTNVTNNATILVHYENNGSEMVYPSIRSRVAGSGFTVNLSGSVNQAVGKIQYTIIP
ncbi:MAG: hypothetical protein MUE53_05900 [Chitinophagales bacterium]|nr:hypothetical protein [Chitinophagales bacterium]